MQTALDELRDNAIAATVEAVREAIGDRPDRAKLDLVREVLYRLAGQSALFPEAVYRLPAETVPKRSQLHTLHIGEDKTFALYINTILPGKNTNPHNHGTWVAVVALEGEELNRIYRRVDDGGDPDHAKLEQVDEVVVRPGRGITFMPDDIHSIHCVSGKPARHLHMYGRALSTLSDRLGFDMETGRIVKYNTAFLDAARLAKTDNAG